MDASQQSSRLNRGFIIFVSFLALFILSLFIIVSVSYFKSVQIEDPRGCFITKMNKVNLCPKNQNYLKYKQAPPLFFNALILSEDAGFYGHEGFDWFEIKESFRRNIIEWRFARGGSTLTQQLAKNMYLKKEKKISRKLSEFFIAQKLEAQLSKSEILEKYMNVVEFDENVYGLSDAAYHYFKKDPQALNLLEIVYLVSLLPNPKKYGQSRKSQKLSRTNLQRMKTILSRLYRTHKINDEIYVYSTLQIEQNPWPFAFFNEYIDFNDPFLSVEEELQNEIDRPNDPSQAEQESNSEFIPDHPPSQLEEYEQYDDGPNNEDNEADPEI